MVVGITNFHHKLRELWFIASDDKIEIIADNMENYKSFTIEQLDLSIHVNSSSHH